MILITVVWSLVFLGCLCAIASARYRTGISLTLTAFYSLSSFCFLFSIVGGLQGLCVAVGIIACALARSSAAGFRVAVISASLLAFGIASWRGMGEVRRIQQLAADHPFESMAPRLAYEDERHAALDASGAPVQPVRLDDRWIDVETKLAQQHSYRDNAIEKIHASATQHFIEAQSFGIARMVDPTFKRGVHLKPRGTEPIAQPSGMPDDGTPDLGVVETQPGYAAEKITPLAPPQTPEEIWKQHALGLDAFLSPDWNGLVRDRDQVAGFLSHQFTQSRYSSIDSPLPAARLELVSLLKYDTPRAYMSKYLPRMEDLKKAPTRPLEPFEQQALEKLQQGEDLVSAEEGTRLRALGALRALRQCQQCHTVREGELLGAFSYTWWTQPSAAQDLAPPSSGF